MKAPQTFTCDLCSATRRPDEPWFLLFDQSRGEALTFVPWKDELASGDGVFHFCSNHHLQVFVRRLLEDGTLCVGPAGIVWSGRQVSVVHDWSVPPARRPVTRFPGGLEDADPDTLLAMLEAVEVLKNTVDDSAPEEPEMEYAYDA